MYQSTSELTTQLENIRKELDRREAIQREHANGYPIECLVLNSDGKPSTKWQPVDPEWFWHKQDYRLAQSEVDRRQQIEQAYHNGHPIEFKPIYENYWKELRPGHDRFCWTGFQYRFKQLDIPKTVYIAFIENEGAGLHQIAAYTNQQTAQAIHPTKTVHTYRIDSELPEGAWQVASWSFEALRDNPHKTSVTFEPNKPGKLVFIPN